MSNRYQSPFHNCSICGKSDKYDDKCKIVVKGRLYREISNHELQANCYSPFFMCSNCIKKMIKKNHNVGFLKFGEV